MRELINKDQFVPEHSPHQWAIDITDKHIENRWIPEEVPMSDDIRNWKEDSGASRKFIQNIMLFFTQADVEVENTYIDEYIPMYKGDLAIKSMLTEFAAGENIHVKGYKFLVKTLGIDDSVLSAWLDNPNLVEIHNVLNKYSCTAGVQSRFKRMVATSLLGEGTMLFGMFAQLLNYQRINKYNGMCTIVAWSIRDEDMHVGAIAHLIKIDKAFNEIPLAVRQNWLVDVFNELMPLIIQFTVDCFNGYGELNGISLKDTINFLEYQAARRIRQANIDEHYGKDWVNPFPWFDQIVGGIEDANFFERRRTSYSKNNVVGTFVYPMDLLEQAIERR